LIYIILILWYNTNNQMIKNTDVYEKRFTIMKIHKQELT
jgi:hypothetical protein